MATLPLKTHLRRSLEQLNSITRAAYGDEIRDIALDLWAKHLSPHNPQWQYLTFQTFSIDDKESGQAHVMAFVDSRLPDIGMVGYFACTNADVGASALTQASQWLKKTHKRADIYGPINGTLPSDYRLNTTDSHIFPGEPVNPKWHIDAFKKAGFDVFNRYVSGQLRHFPFWLALLPNKLPSVSTTIEIRPFDNAHFEADFRAYHELRNQIFPYQSIYCPAISLEERIYHSPGKFDPKYTYFLTDAGVPVGFVMAYIYRQKLILKTIGLLPEYRGKHLASLLIQRVHDQARSEGITTAIYGMVRVGNRVHRGKHPMARVIARYMTMHKKLS